MVSSIFAEDGRAAKIFDTPIAPAVATAMINPAATNFALRVGTACMLLIPLRCAPDDASEISDSIANAIGLLGLQYSVKRKIVAGIVAP